MQGVLRRRIWRVERLAGHDADGEAVPRQGGRHHTEL